MASKTGLTNSSVSLAGWLGNGADDVFSHAL
jgi:hypothetical protein